MNTNQVQIGLPCVYEELCFWAGVGFALLVLGLVSSVVISVIREKKRQQRKRLKRNKHVKRQ